MSGRILLQVEKNGEAWYVSPGNNFRYFLGRPADAFRVMRELGVGISNANLEKIPVGLVDFGQNIDSDSDGLPDKMEEALGLNVNNADTDGDGHGDAQEIENDYNPLSGGESLVDYSFTKSNLGKIFLQVERNGEAWYLDPKTEKRYFLGRPNDAFRIMRLLGTGITNNDLATIKSFSPDFLVEDVELVVHDLINKEREKEGLGTLKWNDDLANVAREHSANLARENEDFTGLGKSCDYPIIHHEGFNFGIYNRERLENRNVHYYEKIGENIALMSVANINVRYMSGDGIEKALEDCEEGRDDNQNFSDALKKEENEDKKLEMIKSEIDKRKERFENTVLFEDYSITWSTKNEISISTVEGWMNSPGHRKNILTEDFDEAGIGSVYINGYLISTQVFIKRAECGYKDGACCEKEGYYPYCFTPLECNQNNICY